MNKCPQCPYYEQKTSYGTEKVKCDYKECPKREGGEAVNIQTLINNEALKPCPFCGKKMTLISSSRTKQFTFSHKGLRNCPFYQFEISWECAKSLKEATELWNRREGGKE